MLFSSKAKEVFDVSTIESGELETFLHDCLNVYKGKPYWLSDDIKTVNFAKLICSETAKLATVGMSVIIEGDSDRVKVLQKQIDDAMANMRSWVEYAGAGGTVILKPNGKTIDVVASDRYMVTDTVNNDITGVIFVNQDVSKDGKVFYTRLEYHRFVDGLYVISNKCYKGYTKQDTSQSVGIEDTPWAHLEEEIAIDGIDRPLFGVLRMPNANSIDVDSPIALPIFADAIEELKDLDIAYSRNAKEIYDSKRTTLIDQDRLLFNGKPVRNINEGNMAIKQMQLPDYVRMVGGSTDGTEMYQEINPTLQTDVRMVGVNALLSQIGFKCGFSNGYFVFNESTGFATATQVTADQARTIQLIEDIRKNIDYCIIDLIKALNVFEDLYGTTRHLVIEDTITTDDIDRIIHVHFEPIYTNKEEDRMRALQLTNSGYLPRWYYLHMYEGFSEEEAKALAEEAQPKEKGLFDE